MNVGQYVVYRMVTYRATRGTCCLTPEITLPGYPEKRAAMDSAPVLILGSYKEKKLNDALSRAGFTPVVRRSMQEALDKVRHERFVGILLERDWVDVDVLEFILNVREYATDTRIRVVGNSGDPQTDRTLARMDRTFNVGQVEDADDLTEELLEVLSSRKAPDG